MFNHVSLKVKEIAASASFYEAALAPLGIIKSSSSETSAGFGPPGKPGFFLSQGKPSGVVHIAFDAKTRAQVDAFHQAGLAAGGKDNGKAGLRPAYGPSYYGAFLYDPDGNNIEAVCLK
jgi:catechol 2,3-dioxygenase-like lactoylglutathione lyase family enzyme